MAAIVELFGAPGVGKSSLVRTLDGRRVAGRMLLAAHHLGRVPRSQRLGTGPARIPRLLERLLRRDLTPAERRAALADQRDAWAELLEVVAAGPLGRDDQDPLRLLHAPGWLAATLELRALAETAPPGVVTLLDEGLVQRLALVCGREPEGPTLDRFIDALPPATLYVHLQTRQSTLVSRLRERERVIDRHLGLTEERLAVSVGDEVKLLARAAGRLTEAGHNLLTLDAAASLDALAAQVMHHLERMLPKPRR